MKCDCCGRSINPATATKVVKVFEWGDGTRGSRSCNYGPVCAIRLKLVEPASKVKRHRLFSIGRRVAVKAADGQPDLFEGMLC